MFNLPQLFRFLTSYKDSRLNSLAFKMLMTKALQPKDEAEKNFLNESIMFIIKAEIDSRLDSDAANHYKQLVEEAKYRCDILEYLLDKI